MHASHTKLTTVGDSVRQQPPEKTLGRHSVVPGTRVKGSKENSSTGHILSSSGKFFIRCFLLLHYLPCYVIRSCIVYRLPTISQKAAWHGILARGVLVSKSDVKVHQQKNRRESVDWEKFV